MTTATTTAPDTMIDASFNFPSAGATPVQTFGPYPMPAWKARAVGVLANTRVSAAPCRAWHRDPPAQADLHPESLQAVARELQDYAHACRHARWDGTALESAVAPLDVFGGLMTALSWVAPKLAAHDPCVTPQDLAEWRETVLTALLSVGCQTNVPPAIDRDLARDGYTTAELVAERVHVAADMLLGLYRRLPTSGPEAYPVGLAINSADDALANVLVVIKEGVQFGLGMQRAVAVVPGDAALWAKLMARAT